MDRCPRCQSLPEVGVLCAPCAALLAPREELLVDHVRSRSVEEPAAWLVDGFGGAHPVTRARYRVGRRQESELVVLHGSVSRDHAELSAVGDGWQVRDLGSRNGSRVDGRRVEGRAAAHDLELLRFGDVVFLFVARPSAIRVAPAAPATTQAAGAGNVRILVHGPGLELCALGSLDDGAGGALLHRRPGGTWQELSLPPLEFHLLRILCASALDGDAVCPSAGAVLAKSLARALPFQSRYASDENVRQVVRRLRATLEAIGATGLVETAPGRGYFVAWRVSVA